MKLNPTARAVLGGIAAAIVVATPIVDNGLLPSEILSIAGAFLAGSGLAALPNGRQRAEVAYEPKHRA